MTKSHRTLNGLRIALGLLTLPVTLTLVGAGAMAYYSLRWCFGVDSGEPKSQSRREG